MLGIAGVRDGRTDTIFEDVKESMREKGLDGRKLAAVCTDGAAVMTGCRQGAVKKIKEFNPDLIGIHSTAHSLTHADSDCEEVSRQFEVNFCFFDFFNNFANRSNKLHELQKQLEEPQLNFTQSHAVRWLCVHSAVQIT